MPNGIQQQVNTIKCKLYSIIIFSRHDLLVDKSLMTYVIIIYDANLD